MIAVAPVGVQEWQGVSFCGCGHDERSHFPACLATIHRTENEYGGGTTVYCGCPNFGSPAGVTTGRRSRNLLVKYALRAALGDTHA